MKKINIFILLIVLFTSAFSQTVDSTIFTRNFEAAKEQALQENKDVLLVFAGTDWCKL